MASFVCLLVIGGILLNNHLSNQTLDPNARKELESIRSELLLKLSTLDNKREIAKIRTQIRKLTKKLSRF